MSTISKILLLACAAAIVFARFEMEQAWIFWTLLALLFPLTGLMFLTTFYVSKRQAIRYSGTENDVSILPMMTFIPPEISDSRSRQNTFGRLMVINDEIVLLVREKGKIGTLLTISKGVIAEFSTGTVYGSKRGVVFTLKDESTRIFTAYRMKNLQNELIQALGWPEL